MPPEKKQTTNYMTASIIKKTESRFGALKMPIVSSPYPNNQIISQPILASVP
jgi:hypothetical protein